MTEEERKEALFALREATRLAAKYGDQLVKESDANARVTMTAGAIMFSTFCRAAGLGMHQSIDLFMAIHKQTTEMYKDL